MYFPDSIESITSLMLFSNVQLHLKSRSFSIFLQLNLKLVKSGSPGRISTSVSGKRDFYTTDLTDNFQRLGSILVGQEIVAKKIILE